MNTSLQPLMAKLKGCPSHEASVSRELFIESWADLCREDVSPFVKPSPPVMAALLLHDEQFTGLLNETEQTQLTSLVQLALERYDQQTRPPNKLGKLIAGCIIKKE